MLLIRNVAWYTDSSTMWSVVAKFSVWSWVDPDLTVFPRWVMSLHHGDGGGTFPIIHTGMGRAPRVPYRHNTTKRACIKWEQYRRKTLLCSSESLMYWKFIENKWTIVVANIGKIVHGMGSRTAAAWPPTGFIQAELYRWKIAVKYFLFVKIKI